MKKFGFSLAFSRNSVQAQVLPATTAALSMIGEMNLPIWGNRSMEPVRELLVPQLRSPLEVAVRGGVVVAWRAGSFAIRPRLSLRNRWHVPSTASPSLSARLKGWIPMRITRTSLIALAAAGALNVSCAFAQTQNDSNKQNDSSKSQQQQTQQKQQQANQRQNQAPEGYILIDERVVTLTANEPQNHFLRAHACLARGDNRAAAAETRIAAAYLDMQASRDHNTEGGKDLTSAADNLRSVAKEIQSGAPQQGQQGQTQQPSHQKNQQGQTGAQANQQGQNQSPSEQQMTQAFARANHALAQHFQMQAKNELQKNKAVMAGYDIDSAASSLQAACAWSNNKPAQDVQTAVTDARRAAMELLSPNMTAAERQADQASDTQQNKNNTDNEAQPAAAKIAPSDQSQTHQADASQTEQENKDARKALDELDKAIQSTVSDTSKGSAPSGK